LTDVDVTNVVAELQRHGVVIDQGPVERTGARGTLISVYVRDPDANLIELSQYLPDP
jgi:catechol 2,3-dioxygenase-like lactoylglutathione lyase family enzyme